MPAKPAAPQALPAASAAETDVLDIFNDRSKKSSASKSKQAAAGGGARPAVGDKGIAQKTRAPGGSGSGSGAGNGAGGGGGASGRTGRESVAGRPNSSGGGGGGASSGSGSNDSRGGSAGSKSASPARTVAMPHDEQPAHRFEARERIRHLGAMTRTPMGEYISSDHPLSQLAVPTPGPLDYDPKLQPSGVQYSILGKHATAKEERTNIGPGPAKYDVRGIRLPYSDTPHWSFGHKFPEQKVKDDTPSPFAYNDTHNTFGKNNLSYTISGRFSGSESETPGPDRYFPKAEFGPTGTMPKYSFGLKPLLIDDPTPGPHDYDVPTDPPDAPCGPSFTMRRRLDESFRNKDTKPGPNQYYPKIPASEKMASLKGMHKENKSLKTPGPANYIIPANLFSGPHYTLTARNIPFQDDVFVAPNPGPTDYNPDAHLTLNKAPTFSLGSRPKSSRHESDNIPGPGAYHPRDRQIRGNGNPKVTIKGRHKSHIDKTPGPADYNSHVPAVNPTAAQLARNEAGRPMGAERLKNVIEESPGPADYQLKPVSVVKPCGPKYSLRKRLESQKIDQTPGPNAYYALPKKNGGSTTMKSRASPFVMVFPTNRVDTLRV